MGLNDISKRIKEFNVNNKNIDNSIDDVICLCREKEGNKTLIYYYSGKIKNLRKLLKL